MLWFFLVECQCCFVRAVKLSLCCECLPSPVCCSVCLPVRCLCVRREREVTVKVAVNAHGTPQINQLEQEQGACLNFTCCGMSKPWINKDQIKPFVCPASQVQACVCKSLSLLTPVRDVRAPRGKPEGSAGEREKRCISVSALARESVYGVYTNLGTGKDPCCGTSLLVLINNRQDLYLFDIICYTLTLKMSHC